MKMHASCPICGYKLCKGESGSDVDILCSRCSKLIRVVITETNTNCTPTDHPKKVKKTNGGIRFCGLSAGGAGGGNRKACKRKSFADV